MTRTETKRRCLTRLHLLPLVLAAAVGLDGCALSMRAAPPSPADSLTARTLLTGVFDDYWLYLKGTRPALAAQAGLVVPFLPNRTLDGAKRDAQFSRAALLTLDAINVEALSEDAYVSWLTMRWDNEALGSWAAFHWTRLSDLAPGRSVFDESIEILRYQSIRNATDGQRFLGLLRSMVALCRVTRFEFEERANRGVRLPRASLLRATAHLRSQIAPAAASPFGLPATFTASRDTAWQVQLDSQVVDLISKQVNPALDSLAAFLELEQDQGLEEIGLSQYPGGAQHYAALLRFHSTLDVTPTDAHAIGLREVERIAVSVAAARREARLPADRDSLRAALARDTALAITDRSALPVLAARMYESFSRELDTLFRPSPTVRLSIGLIPADAETESPLSRYDAPTATEDARYRLNASRLVARSGVVMPALVLADLMPGLHRQQAVQRENDSLPTFRRLGFHGGFVNGWQTYVLAIADSATGALSATQRFGVRLRELAAACGLVVDTGINAVGWTRTDALQFLRAYLPDDDAELEREFITEAIEAPGALSAAALGTRELHGLRRWAERELGERFTLAAFNHELLRTGSVPLPVLGSHLERWIWELKNAPAARP